MSKEEQVLAVRTVEPLHSLAFTGGRYTWACARGQARTDARKLRSAARVAHAASPAVSPRGPSWLEHTPCGRHREPGGTRGQEDRRRGTHADTIDRQTSPRLGRLRDAGGDGVAPARAAVRLRCGGLASA